MKGAYPNIYRYFPLILVSVIEYILNFELFCHLLPKSWPVVLMKEIRVPSRNVQLTPGHSQLQKHRKKYFPIIVMLINQIISLLWHRLQVEGCRVLRKLEYCTENFLPMALTRLFHDTDVFILTSNWNKPLMKP